VELLWLHNGSMRRIRPAALVSAAFGFLAAVVLVALVIPVHYGEPERADQVAFNAINLAETQRVRDVLITTDAQMSILAARLGELQGRLTRIESIGQQVGELAGFDTEVLGLDQPVAIGGPMADDSTMQLPELLSELREYSARLEDRAVRFELLDAAVLARQVDAQRLPRGKPTRSGWLSSAYGYRTHPLNGRRQFHQGVDLAGAAGDPVEAVASGLVTWSGARDGYGNLLEVDHRNGYVTRYGHNKKNLVAVGELVRQGQVIATMGSTGRSTGPHVHFEVLKNGKRINPKKFLRGSRVALLTN